MCGIAFFRSAVAGPIHHPHSIAALEIFVDRFVIGFPEIGIACRDDDSALRGTLRFRVAVADFFTSRAGKMLRLPSFRFEKPVQVFHAFGVFHEQMSKPMGQYNPEISLFQDGKTLNKVAALRQFLKRCLKVMATEKRRREVSLRRFYFHIFEI